MMTLVLKDVDTNKTYVFSKGAESVIFKKVKDQSTTHAADASVLKFSKMGYRTLVYAMREIPEYKAGMRDDELEKDLRILGITGVEDIL